MVRVTQNLPTEVVELLDAVLAEASLALSANLVGLYVRGSLALGDFIPETSDVDLLAVTERPVGETEFTALSDAHARLAAIANPFARRFEIAYMDRAAFRRFRPGRRHPTLGQGETLAWTEHHSNWLLERWAVRACGIALLGPDPRTLVDPVTTDEIRRAVRDRLRDWADWAVKGDDPDWALPRSHKAYAIETMCRALYTLANGELASKPRAVAWALQTLPEPWRSTVRRSQHWRADTTADPAIAPQVRAFILWATDGETHDRIEDETNR